jgi:hypothetical protein
VRSKSENIEHARLLLQDITHLYEESNELRGHAIEDFSELSSPSILSVELMGDEVTYLSTMTLIHRAIPPPERAASRFSSECIETARKAIITHLKVMKMLKQDQYYLSVHIHWYV